MLTTHDNKKPDIRGTARYEMIHQVLQQAIKAKTLPVGLVMLEGPLAELFGTSRVPVRRALGLLHEEGLISRFEGRGFIVATEDQEIEPVRMPLNRTMLGFDQQQELVDTRSTGEKVLSDLHEALSTCMVFGHYQLNEASAAEFYHVSRNVIRESLMRLRDRGLVEKEPYSQWLAGPLTAREIREHYEVRASLEPAALRRAGPLIPQKHIEASLTHIERIRTSKVSTGAELEQVEDDLHLLSLEFAGNRTLVDILRQSHSTLTIARIFHETLSLPVDEAMVSEHQVIYQLLLEGRWDLAAQNLDEHLANAQNRTLKKLKVLSVLPEPTLPPYLHRLS
ncbi:GntR family transcriptional regulator [Lonsdalea britannica]|uniref:GntR family transcriptional regulator n=1 Tax=Lonsdalea britannica TaxID=1082704 RepID=UPI0026E951B3|nr:GntR family transcriptional regulator [Lonsdalea britannica]